ncbi:MAG: GntR family transcriptional regulator [Tissierellia bacterium]|nr:GntR family transcriptional regulator [Tissierellia bacterium]
MEKSKSREKQTLSQIAYEYIKNKINRGEYKDGEIITEQSIGNLLNMSRTPVKKALTQLEGENYVKCLDGVGTIVIGLSIKDLTDIYEVRKDVEILALKSAIHRINFHEIEDLKRKVEQVLDSYHQREYIDPDYVSMLDYKIHDLIIRNSNNNYVKKIMEFIISQIMRYQHDAYYLTDTIEESSLQHMEILNHIENKDYENAREALELHMNWSLEVLTRAFTNL